MFFRLKKALNKKEVGKCHEIPWIKTHSLWASLLLPRNLTNSPISSPILSFGSLEGAMRDSRSRRLCNSYRLFLLHLWSEEKISRMWESVQKKTERILHKAVFTNHPIVLNLHTNMYYIYLLTKKKNRACCLTQEKIICSLHITKERTISLNIYLLNPIACTKYQQPRAPIKQWHRRESDHNLTSYTPLITQLNQLIWLLPLSFAIP